jgi:hypothetical protein
MDSQRASLEFVIPYIPPQNTTADTMIAGITGMGLRQICNPICTPSRITDSPPENMCDCLKKRLLDAIPVSMVYEMSMPLILSNAKQNSSSISTTRPALTAAAL